MTSAPSILVVDDEPNSLFGICQVLSDEGFQTIPANNGKEALEKLRTHAISLIITDERMPDLTGMELLLEVRNTSPHSIDSHHGLWFRLDGRRSLEKGCVLFLRKAHL